MKVVAFWIEEPSPECARPRNLSECGATFLNLAKSTTLASRFLSNVAISVCNLEVEAPSFEPRFLL